MGLTLREAGECRRCGDHLGETTDYEHNRYVAQPPVVCLKCLALSKVSEEYKGHPEAAGMIHQVKRVDRPKRG